jgi:hypothetical protein
MNKKYQNENKDLEISKSDNESNSSSDMNALMSKMQNMMKKMDNIDNLDEDEAEGMLQKMLSEVNNVTKSVQSQFHNLTQQLMDNPDIPESEKKKYLGLEKNLGQLTSALSKGNSNPEEMEKTLNSLMGNLKNTMGDLNEDEDELDLSDFEYRLERLEERFDKLENIVRKIAERLKK